MVFKKIIMITLMIAFLLVTTGMAAAQDHFMLKEWNYYYSNRGEDFFWNYKGRERGNIHLVWVKRDLASDRVQPDGVITVLYLFGFDFKRDLVTRYYIKTYTAEGLEDERPDYSNRWHAIKHSSEYIRKLVPWICRRAEFEY